MTDNDADNNDDDDSVPLTTVRGGPSTQATMTPATMMPPRTPPRTPTMPTTPATPGGTQMTHPRPTQRLIRKSAGGVQKFRIYELAASDHVKHALKRREKNKASGLLRFR